MTRFLCFELLYEYVSGTLDSAHTQDIKEFIESNPEAQRELEKLQKALSYCGQAGQAQVGGNLREALLRFEPLWQKRLRELTMWSSQRGWRLLPYIFVALTVVSGLFVFKPWQMLNRNDVILAQQLKGEPDMLPIDATLPPPPPKESLPLVETKPASPTPAAVTVAAKPEPKPESIPQPSAPQSESQSQAQVQANAEAEAKADGADTSVAGERKHESPTAVKGELIRGEIEVGDFMNTWPAIKDKIVALGGKAAGTVELGWLRRQDQSYFHFTLPESNYAELELFLATFGPVRFSTERHPRVMPEGQIRIIMTVKDASTYEGSSETP